MPELQIVVSFVRDVDNPPGAGFVGGEISDEHGGSFVGRHHVNGGAAGRSLNVGIQGGRNDKPEPAGRVFPLSIG